MMRRRLSVPAHPAQRGLTLIELLVAMVLGLVMSLAIYAVLATAEGRKRTTTTANDVDQAGAYALYRLDRLLRSAGSGFAQSHASAYGCLLNVVKSGTVVLPRPASLPAPFAGLGTHFRLAPVLIAAGQTTPDQSGQASDALIVMTGASGLGEYPTSFSGTADPNQLKLSGNFNFSAKDLVLVADQPSTTGAADCLVTQVADQFNAGTGGTTLDLGGTYHPNNAPLGNYSTLAMAVNLGNVAAGRAPSFLVLGVGANNTLFAYDLLQTGSEPLSAVADNVFEMHALYYVDSDGDGLADAWRSPVTDYPLALLSNGSAAAAKALASIKAIRVGLILRGSLTEKVPVSPGPLTLFGDLPSALQYQRTLSTLETRYRYRTLDATIPLRNALLVD